MQGNVSKVVVDDGFYPTLFIAKAKIHKPDVVLIMYCRDDPQSSVRAERRAALVEGHWPLHRLCRVDNMQFNTHHCTLHQLHHHWQL